MEPREVALRLTNLGAQARGDEPFQRQAEEESMRTRTSQMQVAMSLAIGVALQLAGCNSPSSNKKTAPSPYPSLDSPSALIKTLEVAYRRLDYDKFVTLFASEDSVSYVFLLSESTQMGETSWGAAEEIRIHRRMFRPKIVVPHETPVREEQVLQTVDISLIPQTEFVERADLYRSVSNPGGLDSVHWRATEATYGAYVIFQLAGSTDYQIDGRANFVVIEDKTKLRANDPGKWLLYRWEDLHMRSPRSAAQPGAAGIHPAGVERATWSTFKGLYR